MTTTILFILVSVFLLMVALRIGYTWGRRMAESIAQEYAEERQYMECLKLGNSVYPDMDENVIGEIESEKTNRWQEHWRLTGPRSN